VDDLSQEVGDLAPDDLGQGGISPPRQEVAAQGLLMVTRRLEVAPHVPRHIESSELAAGTGHEPFREELLKPQVGRDGGALPILGTSLHVLPSDPGSEVFAGLDLWRSVIIGAGSSESGDCQAPLR